MLERKKVITRKDIIYKNGFPANIDLNKKIVIQITPRPEQSVVLYTANLTGKPTRSYFGYEFSDRYELGIFEL